MSRLLTIHPKNPEPRRVRQAAERLMGGGVIVYPTDSTYALGCRIGDKGALERIRLIRRLDSRHNFTLMCGDLSSLANYARVDNRAYRILKAHTPGPYTFILEATPEVPRRLKHPKRKSIGLRVPDHAIARAVLDALGEPIMSTSLILPERDLPLRDPDEILEVAGKRVDLIVDGGPCGLEPTTVIDLLEGTPAVTRVGKGDPEPFR